MTPTGAIRLFLPCAVAVFLPTGTATAELLPEALGPFERTSLEPFQPPQADLFAELGLEEAEQGRYLTAQGEALELTAYRFQDSTGAFASYQWLRPDGGELVPYGEQALRQGNATTIRFGSYVVQMEGPEADDEHVEAMLAFLPRVTLSARPPRTEVRSDQPAHPVLGAIHSRSGVTRGSGARGSSLGGCFSFRHRRPVCPL